MCTDGAEEGWAGVKKTTAGRPWPGRVGEGQRDTPLYDGTQKVEHLPHGEKSEHEYPSSYTHWSAMGRGKFRENYRCFWRLMRKEGILSSNLPLSGFIVWLQWSSARGLLCRAGLSSATEAWYVSSGRNLASDGAHEHVLGLLPILHPVVQNQPGNTGDVGSISWVGKILWRRKWQPTPVFCSPVFSPMDRGAWRGYSPRGHKELD